MHLYCTHTIITDNDDEFFCNNINMTLPTSLQPPVNPNPNPETASGGATSLTTLILPTLMLTTLPTSPGPQSTVDTNPNVETAGGGATSLTSLILPALMLTTLLATLLAFH